MASETTIYYFSGWQKSYIYYRNFRNQWKYSQPMKKGTKYGWQSMRFCMPRIGFEFVLTDGGKDWDNPGSHNKRAKGENYFITEPGIYALYRGKLYKCIKNKPILLATTVDGTLIEYNQTGKEAASRFFIYWMKNHMFNGSKLVYNTGRSLDEYLSLFVQGFEIHHPEMLITSQGDHTFTVDPRKGNYVLCLSYVENISRDSWNVGVLGDILKENFPCLQRLNARSDFTHSACRKFECADVENQFSKVKDFLANKENRVTQGKVLKVNATKFTHENDSYAEFSPVKGGKCGAMRFSQNYFGFNENNTFVSGDSANDIPVLKGDEHGVIVRNMTADVQEWTAKKDVTKYNKYVSQLKYADAIIEGLKGFNC